MMVRKSGTERSRALFSRQDLQRFIREPKYSKELRLSLDLGYPG